MGNTEQNLDTVFDLDRDHLLVFLAKQSDDKELHAVQLFLVRYA